MDFIRHLIDEITTNLIQQKKIYVGVIRKSSKGRIICETRGEKLKLIHNVPMGRNGAGRNEYQRRSLAGNPELLAALATKEYARVALKIIDHNLDILTKAMNALLPMDPGPTFPQPDEGFAADGRGVIPAIISQLLTT